MEWLSDGISPIFGLVGTLGTVSGAIWYVTKFLHAFTAKLEAEGARKDERIETLEREHRRSQRRLGRALFLLDVNGITFDDPDPDED